ncbi:MAG: arylesterase [Dinoroseobacter sp.]|nr:arylesterase [Dinoroseobacter sp.]
MRRLRSNLARLTYGVRTKGLNLLSAGIAAIALGAPVQAETVIAALGDSLTQGYGLVPEQGFVPQLEAWLIAEGEDVRLINAGVSGDTTAGGLARVDWTLTDDVDAMIVALGGNDLLRAIPPEASRANLDGILKAASTRNIPVLLIGLSAPGNYGPDYKTAFDAIYPELAEEYGALYVESFLGALQAEADQGAALRQFMQSDGIHPNADGVGKIVAALGPQVRALIAQVE